MKYRIEFSDRGCCKFASSRKDLIEQLALLEDRSISDVRKVYKSGSSDSVLDRYRPFIKTKCPCQRANTDRGE